VGAGVHTGSTRHCGHYLAYCTCPAWLRGWRSWWNEMVLAAETGILGKNLPRRHFVYHKSHLPDPGANPCRRGGKPATNRFSYGVAILTDYIQNTYLRSWALLEEPPILQPLKNFPPEPAPRRWNTVFTRAYHWSLSWALSIQSKPHHPILPLYAPS
jgi:hypothetical protein